MSGIIAAISTPPGKGGVAVIRVSGSGSLSLAERIFSSASGRALSLYPPRTQVYGYIINNGERLDDCLVCYFPEGGSYTGEETLEISCHGGALISASVLETVIAAGARYAEPGEFTKLAFLNGSLTLTEAEAIGDLLEARTRDQIRLASSTSRSKLSEAIQAIRNELTELLSDVYARIDYPEEDLGEFSDNDSLEMLLGIRKKISALTDSYRTGRAISEGIDTVICGRPNVGKSTLYNALLGEDAAIVTDVAGTTRDLLQSFVSLGRVMLRLTDTAGIRESSSDKVEKIGIDRTRARISDCDLILAVFDGSSPLCEEDREVIELLRSSSAVKICIINKSDLPSAFSREELPDLFHDTIVLCAGQDQSTARELILRSVESHLTDESITVMSDPIVSSARQHGALLRALSLVDTAIN